MPHIACSFTAIPNIQHFISSFKGSQNPMEWSYTLLTMHTEVGQTQHPIIQVKEDTDINSHGIASAIVRIFKLGKKFAIKITELSTVIQDWISVAIDTKEETFLWHRTPKISNSLEKLSWHIGKLWQLFPHGTSLEWGQRNLLLTKLYLCPETS